MEEKTREKTHRREGEVKTEAEIEVMSLQAKDCWQLPGAVREVRTGVSLRASRGNQFHQHAALGLLVSRTVQE